MTCVFIVVLALYQMFEYIFCYNAEKKEQKDLLLQQQRRVRQYTEVDHDESVEAESLLQQPDIALETFSMHNDGTNSSADISQHIIDSLTPEELNLNFDCCLLKNPTISDIPSTAATSSEPPLLTEQSLAKDFGANTDLALHESHSQSKMPKR